MIRRQMIAAAALVLAGMMSASTVHAKACPAICKNEIKACKQTCTTKPKAKCKRACKHDIVAICKASGKTTCVQAGSPSAAFLCSLE